MNPNFALIQSGTTTSSVDAANTPNRHGDARHTTHVPALILTVVLALFATDAMAINKCVDSEGAITFTNDPCPASSQSQHIQIEGSSGSASNEPRFDTSSEASTIASRKRVFAALPPDKVEDLKGALLALVGAELLLHPSESRDDAVAVVGAKINGKTADDIFTMADAIKTNPAVQRALRQPAQN